MENEILFRISEQFFKENNIGPNSLTLELFETGAYLVINGLIVGKSVVFGKGGWSENEAKVLNRLFELFIKTLETDMTE